MAWRSTLIGGLVFALVAAAALVLIVRPQGLFAQTELRRI